jgi:hypothetical protein
MPTGDPRDPIVNAVKSLNAQDTSGYAQTLSQTQLNFFREHAAELSQRISLLKGETLTANIISSSRDSSIKNVGYVKYALSGAGIVAITGDTVEQQVFFENGSWRQQWMLIALKKILAGLAPNTAK